jgi:uncharacterized protein
VPATVTRDDAKHRYVLEDGGEPAGFVLFRTRPGLIALVHTEVDERFSGQGYAGTLVRAALDDARAQGLSVLPFCPYANAWMQRHPEYTDLVPEQYREAFAL